MIQDVKIHGSLTNLKSDTLCPRLDAPIQPPCVPVIMYCWIFYIFVQNITSPGAFQVSISPSVLERVRFLLLCKDQLTGSRHLHDGHDALVTALEPEQKLQY